MITKTELSTLWEAIIPQQGQTVGRRADPQHPLDFFITYDEIPNLQLILLTDYQLSLPCSSKQILVRGNKRADGRNAICFSLEDKKLKDQFVSLCWDIMDCSFEIHDRKAAAQSAIKRFKMWQKLFAETRNKKLSETEVKGLIGELSVLKEICVKKYGIKKAVSGWVGPLGADRDFVFEDMWYEAKYVSLSMDKESTHLKEYSQRIASIIMTSSQIMVYLMLKAISWFSVVDEFIRLFPITATEY